MKRLLALVAVIAAAVAGVSMFVDQKSSVIVTGVEATPIASRPNMFMVTLTVQNEGAAVELTDVDAPGAMSVSVMNPGYGDAALVIPAGSEGLFAMDGAHLMLMADETEFTEGSFLPITLDFGEAGAVSTRVLNVGSGMGGMMHHGHSAGVDVDTPPTIALSSEAGLGASGGTVDVAVTDFEFVVADEGMEHVDNQGHAHVYLNGLKLARLYQSEFTLGALMPQTYELKVTLNSNDHRAYTSGGAPVEDTIQFDVQAE